MMSVKKIILFVIVFIVSCVIVIVFNSLGLDFVESEEYLVGEYKIDPDKALTLIFNNEEDKKDDRLNNHNICYRPSDDLTDAIKIYRVAVYAYDEKEPEITVDANVITFEDILGRRGCYVSRTFVTDEQFNNNYAYEKSNNNYVNKIQRGQVYIIYLPQKVYEEVGRLISVGKT